IRSSAHRREDNTAPCNVSNEFSCRPLSRGRTTDVFQSRRLIMHTESLLLTFLDMAIIVGTITALFAVPTLLVMRRFRAAVNTTVVVFAGMGANLTLHAVPSVLHF